MITARIKPIALYHNDFYGDLLCPANSAKPVWMLRFIRRVLSGLLPTLAMVILVGCSNGGGGGVSSTQTPVTVPTGSIQLEGRTKPLSTDLSAGMATPDGVTLAIDEAAISADGTSYETFVTGGQFDSQTSPPTIGLLNTGFATGSYKSLKLTISNIGWSGNWTFSNPSPCDGSASGSGSGSLDLSNNPMTLYFKTADLGGNSLLHYQSTPPLTGYAGDADHPFLLPAPIQVVQDETTMVSLVLETKNTIGCSHLSAFNSTDNGNVAPLREIVGADTQLFGVSGLVVDSYRNQLVVTNGASSSLATYALNGATTSQPLGSITGPETRLNDPVAVVLYSAGQAGGSGDQYLVLNYKNNSLVTFAVTDSANASPLRTIWGLFTGLSKPTGLVLNLDPFGDGDPSKDEILVANNGNNSITSYTRVGNGDTFPLRTLQGSLTELDGSCGIGVDKQNHEVFVTNSNSNTITVYDLYDLDGSRNVVDPNTGGVVTSPHINIPPLLKISSAAGLADPCGIDVDSANQEIYVANKGNNSISVFDLAVLQTSIQDPNISNVSVMPTRSIAGIGTGLNQPIGIQLSGGELLVAHSGGEAVMVETPQITPAVSIEGATANSPLSGNYNVVTFGVDLHQGINGFGSKIPVIHAQREVASFNAQASGGPKFTIQRDAAIKQFQRQLMEPGCDQPDLNSKNAIFGVTADNGFYAFTQDNRGIFNGAFSPDGESFAGVSYDGDEMYVMYGLKSTGTGVPYPSADGTATGDPVYYAYANYNNNFQNISRFLDPPKRDTFQYLLDVGYLYTEPMQFQTLFTDISSVMAFNPMGDYEAPLINPPRDSLTFQLSGNVSATTALHAGGFFENAKFGLAGAISRDSQSLIIVNDITDVDANDCQTVGGIGVGLRQLAPDTYKTKDIKGTYFIAGIGDDYQTAASRDKYFSLSGSITFDGGGSATLVQTKNSEGEVTASTDTYSYQVVADMMPTKRSSGLGPDNIFMDVLKLYNSTNLTTPYASAIIGAEGKILAFYQTGNTRLLGFALLQKQ